MWNLKSVFSALRRRPKKSVTEPIEDKVATPEPPTTEEPIDKKALWARAKALKKIEKKAEKRRRRILDARPRSQCAVCGKPLNLNGGNVFYCGKVCRGARHNKKRG